MGSTNHSHRGKVMKYKYNCWGPPLEIIYNPQTQKNCSNWETNTKSVCVSQILFLAQTLNLNDQTHTVNYQLDILNGHPKVVLTCPQNPYSYPSFSHNILLDQSKNPGIYPRFLIFCYPQISNLKFNPFRNMSHMSPPLSPQLPISWGNYDMSLDYSNILLLSTQLLLRKKN